MNHATFGYGLEVETLPLKTEEILRLRSSDRAGDRNEMSHAVHILHLEAGIVRSREVTAEKPKLSERVQRQWHSSLSTQKQPRVFFKLWGNN